MNFLEFMGLVFLILLAFFSLGHLSGVLDVKFEVREKD